jgi:hypothetical protein
MSLDAAPAMCLLHGDFHSMRADCWVAAADWHDARPHLDDTAALHAYQGAVEQQMLNNLQETPPS